MRPEIEVTPLDASLLPAAGRLLAGYLNARSDGTDGTDADPGQPERCGQMLVRCLDDGRTHCYLARCDGEYAGFIAISRSFSLSKGYPVLRVDGLYVSPAHRNKGVGGRLMRHAVELAEELQACRLQLETDDDNAPARALYDRLGFRRLPGKGVYMAFLQGG